ncbi:MAG: hypothetical protein WC139_07235 [Candidatus Kapaibacterium sp.]
MKTLILTLCLFTLSIFFTSCKGDKPTNDKEVAKETAVKKEKLPPDFRNVNWGMSRSEVLASETKQPEWNDTSMLGYRDTILDMPVGIRYSFFKDKLIEASLKFNQTHTSGVAWRNDYNQIKNQLINKYTMPVTDKVIWQNDIYRDNPAFHDTALLMGYVYYSTYWDLPSTEIYLQLSGDNFTVSFLAFYYSKKFEAERKEMNKSDNKNKL